MWLQLILRHLQALIIMPCFPSLFKSLIAFSFIQLVAQQPLSTVYHNGSRNASSKITSSVNINHSAVEIHLRVTSTNLTFAEAKRSSQKQLPLILRWGVLIPILSLTCLMWAFRRYIQTCIGLDDGIPDVIVIRTPVNHYRRDNSAFELMPVDTESSCLESKVAKGYERKSFTWIQDSTVPRPMPGRQEKKASISDSIPAVTSVWIKDGDLSQVSRPSTWSKGDESSANFAFVNEQYLSYSL
jgi:hypothetical protein